MRVNIGRTPFDVYAFDLESHNDIESLEAGKTGVWLCCMIDENSKATDDNIYFYNIESFLDRLEEMTRDRDENRHKKRHNILIYVYNLAHEWSFILPALLSRGFHACERVEKDSVMSFSSVSTKTCSSVWQAIIRWDKSHGEIRFKDLCKIFPGGLRNVAQSFGLETQKGEIDYAKKRTDPDYKVTNEEKIYNFKDCRIVVDVLIHMQERGDSLFFRSLSAASYSTSRMIAEGFNRTYRPYKRFRKFYPELDADETAFLRKTVAGGLTYATPKWQFIDINQRIGHIDFHNFHGSQLYKRIFPHGRGTYFEGAPDHPYTIMALHVKLSYTGVRLHSVIKLIGFEEAEGVELWLWSFELNLMMKAYIGLQYQIIEGYWYHFKKVPWNMCYYENYAKRLDAKKNHDLFGISFYKLLNNSSYGKFLERGHETYFENCINAEGVIDSIEKNRDEIELNAKYTYLPLGSCVPAYSRVELVELALKLDGEQGNVVYMDTDSIFYIINDETDKIIRKMERNGWFRDQIGKLSREPDITRAQFTAAKRYKALQDDETDPYLYHVAGVNFPLDEDFRPIYPDFDELNIINGSFEIKGVKRCVGGNMIVIKSKQLDVLPKYRNTYNMNAGKSAPPSAQLPAPGAGHSPEK